MPVSRRIRLPGKFDFRKFDFPGKLCSKDMDSSSVVVRVEGIAAPASASAAGLDAAAVADLLCSLDGVQKSDFEVTSVDNEGGETATARISCSGADVAEAVVQKIHGELLICRRNYIIQGSTLGQMDILQMLCVRYVHVVFS